MVFANWSSTKKIQMKKIVIFFIAVIIVGLASAQSVSKEKGKTSLKDTVKKKTLVVKQEKPTLLKDTVKKNKALVEGAEMGSDTLSFDLGKLKSYKKNVPASYYHDKFNGKKTSSGVRFDNNKYTAAHKKLPFGTKVRVTNIASGKSIIVVVNDRGPFVKSREIDLSKRAFMEIAKNKGGGVMMVNIEVIEK